MFGFAVEGEDEDVFDFGVFQEFGEAVELVVGDGDAAVLFDVAHFVLEVFVVVDLDEGAIDLPVFPVGGEVAFGPVGVVVAEVEFDGGVGFFDVGAHLQDELAEVGGAIDLAGEFGVVAEVVVPLDGGDFGIFADEFGGDLAE